MKLSEHLNRTILIAIPNFFGDDKTRACTLLNVDATGLWLACDELKNRLGPEDKISAAWTAPVSGFFPFAQILYIVDPSQFAVLARPAPPVLTKPPARTDGSRAHPHRGHQTKRKNPKTGR